MVEAGQRWEHVKRGTSYEVLGVAELQNGNVKGLREGATLAVYRGEDGKLWARELGEFEDGRFVLSGPAASDSPRAIIAGIVGQAFYDGAGDAPGRAAGRIVTALSLGALQRDAARWRALWSSDRIRVMGAAGFDTAEDGRVSLRDWDDWHHMGLEVWDQHPGKGDASDVNGRKVLLAYVDGRAPGTILPESTNSLLPGVTLVKREVDKECGCPEEEWETPWGYLSMHLNAGKPSDAALDNAEAGEWQTTITAPTIVAARAAIFGWAATIACQPLPLIEGGADIDYVAMVDWASRFHDENDNGYGADTRKWCRALHAALSASPTPPIPMIAEAGEREDWLLTLEQLLTPAGNVWTGDEPVWHEAAYKLVRERLSTPATLDNTAAEGREPFGYWVEQRHAEPILLRKPSYIPEPSEHCTVTPLYAATLTAKTEKAK